MAFKYVDGGGPVEKPGGLVLTPLSAVNLGKVIVGQSATVTFKARNFGPGPLSIDAITGNGGEWSFTGVVTPILLGPGQSSNFVLTLTPASPGAKATTVDAAWSDFFGSEVDVTVAVTATGIAAPLPADVVGAWDPSALAYPTTQINRTSDLVSTIENKGSNPFQVTALTFTTGTDFALVAPPALPFTLAAGASQAITIRFTPIEVGNLSDILNAVTDLAGNIPLNLQGICLLVVPIAICVNNDKRIVISGYDVGGLQNIPAPLIVSPDSYDSDQLGSIAFNGSVWEGLGVEKTLFRIGFYYENLGVASIDGTISCFRPQSGEDNLDLKVFFLTFGTALADGTTRYAEVDIIATGEILTLTLGRGASSGPISICAILPFFEPRGLKVKDV